MSKLRDSLRKAKHIVSEPVGSIVASNIQDALKELDAEKLPVSQKAAANGVASLDDSGKVPSAQLPSAIEETGASILAKLKTVDSAGSGLDADLLDGKSSTDFVLTTNISTSTSDTSTTKVSSASATKSAYDRAQAAHTLIDNKNTEYNSTFEKIAERNKVNGYAGLDSTGKLSPNIIPGQTIVNVEVFASTAERNADTSLHKGDMAIVESSGSADLYILKKDPAGTATTDADWLTLQTNVTVDVRSWNSRNGNVMPALGDYTTALILHDGSALDGVLEGIENNIPGTAGDLDAYSKGESDGRFINKTSISNAINSDSTATVASSQAAKTAYDRGNSAYNGLDNKLDKTAKAADSAMLEGQNGAFYRNSSNQNAGTLPTARLPRYRVITANTKLSHGDKALVDMTKSNVTVTLPDSPSVGMCVSVMDAAVLADAKVLIVARNSQPIMGLAEDVVFDVPGYKADFVYLNATKGWVLA